MTKRDIAGYLGVDVQTLRNWRKTRPNLYRTIMQGLAIDDFIAHAKQSAAQLENIAKECEKIVLKDK